MYILAIDTATTTCSVAVTSDTTLLGEILLHEQHHSERIISLIDRLLTETALTRQNIDCIAVAVGPGTFTGLRVGISTAQGLGFALNRPVIGVPSLEILARQAIPAERICPMLEAGKGQVYTCLFAVTRQGILVKIIPETVIEAGTWVQTLSGTTLFTGPGALRYHERILHCYSDIALFAPAFAALPRASTLALIACERFAEHKDYLPEKVLAHYVRQPDARLPL